MDVGPSIANRTIAAQEAVASSAMMMMVVMALETPASMTGCAGNQNQDPMQEPAALLLLLSLLLSGYNACR